MIGLVLSTGSLALISAGRPTASEAHSTSIAITGASGCTAPDPFILVVVDSIVITGDTTGRRVAQLPAGPISLVSAVTDSVICHRAAIASGLAQTKPDSLAVKAVSVIRVGPTRYVVNPIGYMVGEFGTHLTFDSAFTLPPLSVWAK